MKTDEKEYVANLNLNAVNNILGSEVLGKGFICPRLPLTRDKNSHLSAIIATDFLTNHLKCVIPCKIW